MINVSTPAELAEALATAQDGDVIVLAPGDYGAFDFNNYNFSGYVTVQSADPDNPATFDQIDIVNSSYLVIDSVHVDNPSNGAASSKVVNIDGNSHDIVFSNSEVNGSVATSTDYNEFQGHYGIYTGGDVQNIRVEGNFIHDVKNGFVALGSDDIEVVGNRFDRLGNDTMKFAGVTGVLIENNIGPQTNFQSPTAHVDFIQFQGSSQDIVIRGNVYLAGNIGSTQAIFMADGSYDNVLIEQNILYTGMLHGITVYSGTNVTIQNNTVLNAPDLVHKATIIQSPDGATVTGNIISATGYGGKVSDGNLYVQHDRPDQPYYYGDYFVNAEVGLGITLDDLVPIGGSIAEQYGANDRLMELVNGESPLPDPVPQPDPEPQPDADPGPQPEPDPLPEPDPNPVSDSDPVGPDPQPVPEPDPEPIEGTVFSISGYLEVASAADVVEVGHSPELEISKGTVAFSFAAADVAGTQGLVAKDASGYAGGGNHFAVYLDGDTLVVRLQDSSGEAYLRFDGIVPGEEYNVAVTFGPDGSELWVDGELIAATDLVMDWTLNQQYLQWGGLGWASADGAADFDAPFEGTIGNASVYDSVLTATQIDAVANGGSAFPNTTGAIVDQTLNGGEGNDLLLGGEGNDGIRGGNGNDTLYGEGGDDRLPSGAGDDEAYGGAGNDRIGGGAGNDYMNGGAGDDGGGAGPGNDTVFGEGGNDRFNGGRGDDYIDLGAGDDTSNGSFDNDTIYGGAGNDLLGGGHGDDFIFGNEGNDTINPGHGTDVVAGGEGADLFVFNNLSGGGTTVITDFEDGIDTIRVTGLRNPADPVARLDITDTTYNGTQAVEMTYGNHTIIVLNMSESDFTQDDFLFV